MFEAIAGATVSVLQNLNPNATTGLFVVLMLALFTAALLTLPRRRARGFRQSAPTLLTTLGILGTFLGIAIGLLDFDSSRIEYSIPLLLDGLKLAFITSIVGILLSATLRLVLVTQTDSSSGGARAGAQDAAESPWANDPLTLMRQQIEFAEATLLASQQQSEQLERRDVRLFEMLERHHQEQLTALRNFSEQLSEIGSRQLIAALESVVRDFNANLGEQFGENFRRLDASVGKLLEWQEQYRLLMDSLGTELERASSGVAHSADTLEKLTQQSQSVAAHVADQQAVMHGLRRETTELEAVLGSIADLRERAREAFPTIDERLKSLLENIESAVLSALRLQQRGQLDSPTTNIQPLSRTQRAQEAQA